MNIVKVTHLFLLLTLLTGCWDLQEVNEISIVSGLAIDKGSESRYRLTVELFNPSEMGSENASGHTASIVLGIEGDSLGELTHKINTVISRKPIYSHMKTVIISEEIAQAGIEEIFDIMDRHREIRNDFNILVVEAPNLAADALRITYPLQKVSTQKINSQAETFQNEWGGDPGIRLMDLVDAIVSPGREPTTSVIKIIGGVQQGSTVENNQATTPLTYIEMVGNSVFKDNKLIGKMSLVNTRSYLLTQNNLNRTSIAITCSENKTVDIRIKRMKANTTVKMIGGVPKIQINISGEGTLEGSQCRDSIASFKVTDEYEKKSAKLIADEVFQTINLAQKKYGSDIFGFGETLYKSTPSEFNKVKDNWNEVFSEAQVEVDATIKIRRSGLRIDSYLNELNE
ncbi:Ger(x)C family spore germination protein [Sutcliffiella halmapala]|uniref:Ger(x)C family spore germination protein n=1 Tax=Sutcliffiella halmapala TaxID=79882 RepID=UPI0014732EAD|nr:Ger(x)C family spore germination protein [Sutcliffiella halmapala]